MSVQQEFSTPVTQGEAIDRLRRFMGLNGFREMTGSDDILLFVKGSPLLNLLTATPRSWQSRVSVLAREEQRGAALSVRWDISTFAQLVTPWDVNYWQKVVGAMPTAIENSAYDGQIENAVARSCLRKSMILTACALAFGGLAGFVAHKLARGPDRATLIGGIGAILFLLSFRQWRGVRLTDERNLPMLQPPPSKTNHLEGGV